MPVTSVLMKLPPDHNAASEDGINACVSSYDDISGLRSVATDDGVRYVAGSPNPNKMASAAVPAALVPIKFPCTTFRWS